MCTIDNCEGVKQCQNVPKEFRLIVQWSYSHRYSDFTKFLVVVFLVPLKDSEIVQPVPWQSLLLKQKLLL